MARIDSRQERFCRQFVETANAVAAARAAGYTSRSLRATGYRLLRNPRISERIAELQRETAQAQCQSIEILLAKLESIFRQACEDHQYHVATRAVELQAKLAGLTRARPAPALRSPLPKPSNDNT